MDKNTLPILIRAHRAYLGNLQGGKPLTQAKYAAHLKVGVDSVRNWEQGRTLPTGTKRDKLLAAFKEWWLETRESGEHPDELEKLLKPKEEEEEPLTQLGVFGDREEKYSYEKAIVADYVVDNILYADDVRIYKEALLIDGTSTAAIAHRLVQKWLFEPGPSSIDIATNNLGVLSELGLIPLTVDGQGSVDVFLPSYGTISQRYYCLVSCDSWIGDQAKRMKRITQETEQRATSILATTDLDPDLGPLKSGQTTKQIVDNKTAILENCGELIVVTDHSKLRTDSPKSLAVNSKAWQTLVDENKVQIVTDTLPNSMADVREYWMKSIPSDLFVEAGKVDEDYKKRHTIRELSVQELLAPRFLEQNHLPQTKTTIALARKSIKKLENNFKLTAAEKTNLKKTKEKLAAIEDQIDGQK